MKNLLFLFVVLSWLSCKGQAPDKSQSKSEHRNLDKDTSINNGKNPYFAFKELLSTIDENKLQLNLSPDKEELYGIIMDMDFENKAVITLTAFSTGDVSMYMSSGMILIGAGQHNNVKIKSGEYLEFAKDFLNISKPFKGNMSTELGVIKFYFLTNRGKKIASDEMINIYNKSSALTNLYLKAQELVTEVRIAEEKSRK